MRRSLFLVSNKVNPEERALKIQAQKDYCKKNNLPNFALDGRCWYCRHNAYDYMTIEEAGSKLIIGCPVCHHSWCD